MNKLICVVFIFLFGVGCGYFWAMNAYQVGFFGG